MAVDERPLPTHRAAMVNAHRVRSHGRTPAKSSTAVRAAPAAGRYADILRLQGAAGNAAVSSLVAESPGESPLTLQRHSSWEHILLGDTPPKQLGDTKVSAEARTHVLYQEWQRMVFFRADPTRDPTKRFPDVRWFQLKESEFWVSYGELNALADYLAGPTVADTMTAEELKPVLQRMRGGAMHEAGKEFALRGRGMTGMATSWLDWVSIAAGDVKSLDTATEDQGTNRYAGLVSRNACHFAPFSWQRWAHFHTQAREEAVAHHAARKDTVPLKDIPMEAEEHLRSAWLSNGYGDHFLQDSFAAGHLANKTLVMQWWLDYLNTVYPVGGDTVTNLRGHRGRKEPRPLTQYDDMRLRMGSREQPGMAGRSLYSTPITAVGNAEGDRELGDTTTDPQTGQERTDYDRRVAGSGVDDIGLEGEDPSEARHRNYQAYLRFLNSAVLQAGAGAAHDHLNKTGLTVTNKRGDTMWIGGDDTLLEKSGQVGLELAATAASKSRKAIEDLLDTGETEITTEGIFEYVPSSVVAQDGKGGFKSVGLEDWQDEVLHELCVTTVFPELLKSVKLEVIRTMSPEMVEGGGDISVDVGQPPPPPEKGDFPVPSGDTVPA